MIRLRPRSAEAPDHTIPGPFKRCSLCGTVWKTAEDFLNDRENRLDGYQFNIRKVLAGKDPDGLLIFTHRARGCGTSLAVSASSFRAGSVSSSGTIP